MPGRQGCGARGYVDPVTRAVPTFEHHHRRIQGGAARAAVFGASDGLVTNVSLILGVAGAHPTRGVVALVGLSGLVAGACSMAAGEYVSMKAQSELLERELAIERREIHLRPEQELRELASIYVRRGMDPERAHDMARAMMADPELALETHAREELGINPANLGSPVAAAFSSFCSFAVGALAPLVPWLVAAGESALFATIAVGVIAALGLGGGLAAFTGRSPTWSAIRQLAWATAAAGVTWSIGTLVGVGGIA